VPHTKPPTLEPLAIDILFKDEQWRETAGLSTLITRAANAAHAKACQQLDTHTSHEVIVNLSDDASIRGLNHLYRGQDKPTNVLSFPFEDEFSHLVPGPEPLGDIILAFETIAREAVEQDKPLSHHVAHLVAHGVLHLFGYDHLTPRQAEEMENLEQDILATLDIPSPYRSL
jgi:probable rRNA maturation factor